MPPPNGRYSGSKRRGGDVRRARLLSRDNWRKERGERGNPSGHVIGEDQGQRRGDGRDRSPPRRFHEVSRSEFVESFLGQVKNFFGRKIQEIHETSGDFHVSSDVKKLQFFHDSFLRQAENIIYKGNLIKGKRSRADSRSNCYQKMIANLYNLCWNNRPLSKKETNSGDFCSFYLPFEIEIFLCERGIDLAKEVGDEVFVDKAMRQIFFSCLSRLFEKIDHDVRAWTKEDICRMLSQLSFFISKGIAAFKVLRAQPERCGSGKGLQGKIAYAITVLSKVVRSAKLITALEGEKNHCQLVEGKFSGDEFLIMDYHFMELRSWLSSLLTSRDRTLIIQGCHSQINRVIGIICLSHGARFLSQEVKFFLDGTDVMVQRAINCLSEAIGLLNQNHSSFGFLCPLVVKQVEMLFFLDPELCFDQASLEIGRLLDLSQDEKIVKKVYADALEKYLRDVARVLTRDSREVPLQPDLAGVAFSRLNELTKILSNDEDLFSFLFKVNMHSWKNLRVTVLFAVQDNLPSGSERLEILRELVEVYSSMSDEEIKFRRISPSTLLLRCLYECAQMVEVDCQQQVDYLLEALSFSLPGKELKRPRLLLEQLKEKLENEVSSLDAQQKRVEYLYLLFRINDGLNKEISIADCSTFLVAVVECLKASLSRKSSLANVNQLYRVLSLLLKARTHSFFRLWIRPDQLLVVQQSISQVLAGYPESAAKKSVGELLRQVESSSDGLSIKLFASIMGKLKVLDDANGALPSCYYPGSSAMFAPVAGAQGAISLTECSAGCC